MHVREPVHPSDSPNAPSHVLAHPDQRLKVLLADHDMASRDTLRSLLQQEGYEVVVADDGAMAISLYVRENPDVVLVAAMLPALDGYRVTEYIRELSGDGFVPVLLLYPLPDEEALNACLAHGGNDFLTKSSPPALIKAKLESFAKMRRLYHAVRSQRDELAQHNRWLKREYEIAEGVFAKVMHSSGLQAPNLKFLVSPQAIFNGDLLLVAFRPSGEMHLLLGDFTGHGLSAAIGTIPVADIFNGMTAKGFPVPEIVAEINQKLQRILPRGVFFAAALLELDAENRKLSAWVGGVPDILIYGAQSKALIGRFASKSFPLGVIETDQLDCQVASMEVHTGDRIFLCTDGVSEARNPQGAMFSQARLEQCFAHGHEPAALFEHILTELEQFRGTQQQSDDVTLIEVTVDASVGKPQAAVDALAPRPASAWSASFEFGCDSLKGYDPLPVMMQVLLEPQRLHQHKQRIYMVLAELFLNALEHGLLRLDSTLKEGAGGFGVYYKEKELRLSQLKQGTIKVRFQHSVNGAGGQLTIRVEDSGLGFDFQSRLRQVGERQGAHGRGLMMIQSLCESLTYSGVGNIAEACYVWAANGER